MGLLYTIGAPCQEDGSRRNLAVLAGFSRGCDTIRLIMPTPEQPRDTTPRRREIAAYPPPLSFDRVSFTEYSTEEVRQRIRDGVDANMPGYTPQELIFPMGEREEQEVVYFAMGTAMANLRTNSRHYRK
jgi:hypothetical protein